MKSMETARLKKTFKIFQDETPEFTCLAGTMVQKACSTYPETRNVREDNKFDKAEISKPTESFMVSQKSGSLKRLEPSSWQGLVVPSRRRQKPSII